MKVDLLDDHTQDVALKRQAWDEFASRRGGTCKLIRTVDHVYQRLELTIPRPGYDIVFGESDKQNWRVTVTGKAARVEPFSIAPRSIVDNLVKLVPGCPDTSRVQPPESPNEIWTRPTLEPRRPMILLR